MLLIYTPKLTNRLGYTLNVIFKHLLRIEFSITTDADYFLRYGDAKLCYGHKRLDDSLFVKAVPLLFETTIEDQQPHAECRDGRWLLFPVYGRNVDLPFDPFAATFYMVSRYEEYLPHREDVHGRFGATESLAYNDGFLDRPVVDEWAIMLKGLLSERYPDMEWPRRSYRFVQTVDIDAAWSYQHKGMFRTVAGLARDLFLRHEPDDVRRRLRVLTHRETDPFDTFDYIINSRVRSEDDHLIFFVLLADYDQYDKPVSYLNPHMRQLVQHLGDHAKMGIHPGYTVLDNPTNALVETKRLEDILHRTIVRSRFHFLRLQLPRSYRILLRAGIRHDYTMGYADTVGFRAGISSPFPFYDLERDKETELLIHPFCVMDTTLQKYMKLSPDEGVEQYKKLIDSVRRVDGTFCCIVHNQNLCELPPWVGWRKAYEQMLDYAKP